MQKIILTGGGTAGHVTPNLALCPELKKNGFEISYIGSYNGMEKDLVEKAGIPYYGISSGKLRRYFDVKNFTDPFRVIKGYFEARRLMKKIKPDVVFSKGGFVAVPVVMAASRSGIPVISHESDMTPGLANKLSLAFCSKICCNFPETINYLPEDKAVLTGCPIREELLTGTKEDGWKLTGFDSSKPVLLIIGGSLGSVKVNQAVRSILPDLLKNYQVVHLCGKGNLDETLTSMPGYVQYEYMSEPLKHLFAMADIIISRAGANAICELLALQKPALLIPLSAAASRGDQILNARSFKKQGFSDVLEEENLTSESLYNAVTALYEDRESYIQAMKNSNQSNAVSKIVSLIRENCL
ncbi:MAG: undecaprenyldiphospho-muramoylpentapeptide beta-N-acetylglucosaminyltransferase [Lachnospiraceae bacterium]|nr:undecaprenyldiphospho-muramoylpentapeptide beta-N-acetylglucosaminyltransferase [Lachnospiraceae bacterium]